ncbi:MAG: hypothetical protein AMJ62_16115 [Myxococcales bacterium SG8_38]|nr:MAG: hypothetical protein AMJ62_16115 [Myxococcales bacterium SG8_38]
MSILLRDAAARYLRTKSPTAADGAVQRVSIEIELGGRVETVMLSFRDGSLCCVSSDGQSDGPHVLAALQFITAAERSEEAPRISLNPGAAMVLETPQAPELAEALDDLLTAIARVGADKSRYAPSVETAIERVVQVAPQPTPAGLARFVGRLQQEMRSGEIWRIARVLEGASQLVEALRAPEATRESEQRIEAWLGPRPGTKPSVELLFDRTMIEVGREWLACTDRARIERRYLVDAQSGAVYREDRPRNASASLGPCPRELRVGLAEVEAGPTPKRIRVLQYEVQPDVAEKSWERVRQVASRSIAQLTESYRRSVRAYPALGEPFGVIAPYRIETGDVFKAFDSDGHQLVLDRTERRGAVLAFYDLLARGEEPTWLAGRLTDTGGTLCLVPFAFGTRNRPYLRL